MVVDKDPILYPYVHNPHIMVAMSQDAFKKFSPELRPDGTLLIEEDLVKPKGLPAAVKVFAVPATRIAEELGRKMVLNIVMVGFFTAVTGLVSEKAAKEAVKDSVPPSTIDLNMKAFDRGFAYGKKLLAKALARSHLRAETPRLARLTPPVPSGPAAFAFSALGRHFGAGGFAS